MGGDWLGRMRRSRAIIARILLAALVLPVLLSVLPPWQSAEAKLVAALSRSLCLVDGNDGDHAPSSHDDLCCILCGPACPLAPAPGSDAVAAFGPAAVATLAVATRGPAAGPRPTGFNRTVSQRGPPSPLAV